MAASYDSGMVEPRLEIDCFLTDHDYLKWLFNVDIDAIDPMDRTRWFLRIKLGWSQMPQACGGTFDAAMDAYGNPKVPDDRAKAPLKTEMEAKYLKFLRSDPKVAKALWEANSIVVNRNGDKEGRRVWNEESSYKHGASLIRHQQYPSGSSRQGWFPCTCASHTIAPIG